MSKKHSQEAPETQAASPDMAEEQAATETPEVQETVSPELEEAKAQLAELQAQLSAAQAGLDAAKKDLAAKEDAYLRLAAEFDNYRRRTQKEKDGIWGDAKADTAAAFLPVYDNLERALKQDTADAAYKKGVEMTMSQLKEVLSKLGIEEIPALGQPFDPALHNAVMHVDDETAAENTIVEVFQAGFRSGDKVVRFAMVKVAN